MTGTRKPRRYVTRWYVFGYEAPIWASELGRIAGPYDTEAEAQAACDQMDGAEYVGWVEERA